MKKQELLSITEMAKLRKVSSETLRHYDRIGLLKPYYIDTQTKYRYYDIRQYEKLGTIIEMRQLGIPLTEIQSYMKDRNLKNSKRILELYAQKLKEEAYFKLMTYKTLKRKLTFISQFDEIPATNIVHEKTFAERYMITFGKVSGGPKQRAFAITQLESYLTEMSPILASDRVGILGGQELLKKNEDYIPSNSFVLVDKSFTHEEHKRVIPAGKYLTMYYTGTGLEEYNPAFEIINEYIHINQLNIIGDLLQLYKIDVTLTDVLSEKILEIQIPVE